MNELSKHNAEVQAVLEAHGLNWQTLCDYPSSSYLQKLAQHSPAQLDECLSLLFARGMSAPEKRDACPPWPPGTELAGRKPDHTAVWRMSARLNARRALDRAVDVNKTAGYFLSLLNRMPHSQTRDVTEVLCTLLSHEVMSESMNEGKKMSEHTNALKCLLQKLQLDLKERAHGEAVKNGQERALEFCLEDSKRFPEVVTMFKAAFAALKKARREA